MRRKVPVILLVAALALLALLVTSVHDNLQNIPRVRVGPLVTTKPVGDRLRFFVWGDSGTGGEDQYAVAAAMEARCVEQGGVDGLLMVGDNSYQAGFAGVDDPAWQSKIVTPYGSDCLSRATIYPVFGNHDYKGDTAAQIEYSLVNPRWHMPNRFYAVQFGDLAKLVAFDSQPSDVCFRPAFCAVDFLFEQIKAEADPVSWTLVLAHHPLRSAAVRSGGHAGGLRGFFLAPFLCQRIDAWLAGHSHHLELDEPAGCRMQHFVSGGGGAKLHEIDPGGDPEVKFAASRHGFLELVIDETVLTSTFVGSDGKVLYTSQRSKLAPP